MSLDSYRKAMAITYASSNGFTLTLDECEEMSLILTTMAPGTGRYRSTEEVLDYVFAHGAWVREDKNGGPILINALTETIGYLSNWMDTWPSQLYRGQDILDQDALDALQWLDDCGGQMAQENLTGAQGLIDVQLAKEGPLDKFGRKTIVACTVPNRPDPFQSTTNFDLDDVLSWFRTMPDLDTDIILEYIEAVREAIWNLNSCQEPVEYIGVICADELECGLMDVDGDIGSGHSGFVLCNSKSYRDIRKWARSGLEPENREAFIHAGIMGRIHDAVIILRSNTELEDGHFIFADPDLQLTCTYIPEP